MEEQGKSNVVAISAISCSEVDWLECHRRIELPYNRNDWFEKALDGSGVALLPITPQIVSVAVDLPEYHHDPQDRLIIAATIVSDAYLMSADSQFPNYEELAGKLL